VEVDQAAGSLVYGLEKEMVSKSVGGWGKTALWFGEHFSGL
jgi:hypothetical protein